MPGNDLAAFTDQHRVTGGTRSTAAWMLAHNDRGYESFDDFLEDARNNPGQVTIGVGGAAGAHMVMASAIKGAYDIDVRIVPYLPRGTDWPVHSQAKPSAIARQLNERPRKTSNYQTPAEKFARCVAAIS